jgi:rubrerythrin
MPIDFAELDLQDALDLAILIEEEAEERYKGFAKLVGGRYEGDAADVFKMMAANEKKHGEQLAERRKKLFGRKKSRVSLDMIDDVEAPDRGKPRTFMSPRQALEVALEAEVKAHDFYAGALKHVKDRQVKKLFEELKAEEKQHKALLKKRLSRYPEGPDVEESEADEPGSDAG